MKKRRRKKFIREIPAEFLTSNELCRYLGIAQRTLYLKLSKREIPAIKLFSSWRFRKTDIDEWMRSKSNKPIRRR